MSWYAKYSGLCDECGQRFYPGDEVVWVDLDDRTIKHETCEDSLDLRPKPTCPKCFMQISLSGTCGC